MPACLETLVPRSKLRPMSRSQWPKLEGRRGRVHAFALSFPSRSSLPGARRYRNVPIVCIVIDMQAPPGWNVGESGASLSTAPDYMEKL